MASSESSLIASDGLDGLESPEEADELVPSLEKRRFWKRLGLILVPVAGLGLLALAALRPQRQPSLSADAQQHVSLYSHSSSHTTSSQATHSAYTSQSHIAHGSIPLSNKWMHCWHSHMHSCGKFCCCDVDFYYSHQETMCIHDGQIEGSNTWFSCSSSKHMMSCGRHCCCKAGYAYNKASLACENPINLFNNKLDGGLFDSTRGLYYAFVTSQGQSVLETRVQSTMGGWADKDDSFPLASASKLFTAFAAMRTFQLKGREFYPEKKIHTFKGWENFKQFEVHGTTQRADLTIHHLLTHTSGLPFAMRDSKEDIQKLKLFYMPGTKFGYTLGHRVVGWLLRDFWMNTREGRAARIKTVDDTYRFLIFNKLKLSPETKFDTSFALEFGTSGEAGDAALASTGEDMAKLAVVALRKGQLPNGEWLISEANWDKWAVKNLLPGGKLSKELVDWQVKASSWNDWNVVGMKGNIMKQSGDYGWNYFGATYRDSREIGWCGFFSSCLRVSYPQQIAFVMMQRDVADLKKSKPYLVQQFHSMAASLQCSNKTCARGTQVYCQNCPKLRPCLNNKWDNRCPLEMTRSSSLLSTDSKLDPTHFTCYLPQCH